MRIQKNVHKFGTINNILKKKKTEYETEAPFKPILGESASIEYGYKSGFTWEQLGIGTNLKSDSDTLALIRAGIKKVVLNKAIDLMGLSLDEMAVILHTTDRTLRRYSDSTVLSMEQSERIVELAKLYTIGSDVFDGLENFKEWINQPLIALNSKSPKSFLDTSIGIKLLMQLLNRIEYGIYS